MAIILPDVTPQPIPGVRIAPTADETAFGGGPGLAKEGQEVQKIAAATGEIGGLQRIQAAWEVQRANETAAQEGLAKQSAIHTDLLTNRETGLPAYQGKNALAGQDKLWTEYQKSANEIAKDLPNDNARAIFNKRVIESGNAFLQNVKAHVASELDKQDSHTFESLVENKANESASMYGNTKALTQNHQLLEDATNDRAHRLGLDDNQTEKLMRQVMTNYHETVLSQMVNDPAFSKQAHQYFAANKSEMDVASRDRVNQLFDVVPKQQEASAKAHEEQFYKTNLRQAAIDTLDGNMTLAEAQRRFRENQINEAGYNTISSLLKKNDAFEKTLESKPEAFNAIRQAQLSGSKSSDEIQRMILEGKRDKDITAEDGQYLIRQTKDTPPTPRDKEIEAHANTLRDFGQRYFAQTSIFGNPKNQEQTNKDADSLVQDFYTQADKSKATGEDLTKMRDAILKTYAQKKHPGIGRLEAMPDIVIGINGKVNRLLSPDQHSALKGRYKITPSSAAPTLE